MKKQRKDRLRWIQMTDFWLIPEDIMEKVKDEGFYGDILYKYSNEILRDKANLVYVLTNMNHEVCGVCWLTANLFTLSLLVTLYYVKEEYKESDIKYFRNELLQIKDKFKMKHVRWLTSDHEFLEKRGFRKTDIVLMELDDSNGG